MTIFKTQNLRKLQTGFSFGFDVSRKNGFGSSLGFQNFGQVGVSFSFGFQNFLRNRVFRFRFRFEFPPLKPTKASMNVRDLITKYEDPFFSLGTRVLDHQEHKF